MRKWEGRSDAVKKVSQAAIIEFLIAGEGQIHACTSLYKIIHAMYIQREKSTKDQVKYIARMLFAELVLKRSKMQILWGIV